MSRLSIKALHVVTKGMSRYSETVPPSRAAWSTNNASIPIVLIASGASLRYILVAFAIQSIVYCTAFNPLRLPS